MLPTIFSYLFTILYLTMVLTSTSVPSASSPHSILTGGIYCISVFSQECIGGYMEGVSCWSGVLSEEDFRNPSAVFWIWPALFWNPFAVFWIWPAQFWNWSRNGVVLKLADPDTHHSLPSSVMTVAHESPGQAPVWFAWFSWLSVHPYIPSLPSSCHR